MPRLGELGKIRAETLASILLESAVEKHGSVGAIPVSDPDYAEAYGVLRGTLVYARRPNSGHEANVWIDEIKKRFVRRK